MSVATFTKTGSKAATPAKLDKNVFGVSVVNHELLKQAYLGYMSNQRPNLAIAKNRGDVRGGGRKPWRQKGTGNARFGSRRNPIWKGGGVAFGPTGNENYSKELNTRAKRLALRQALSLAAQDDKIIVIESFDTKERKVKPVLELLKKVGAKGRVLLVGSEKNDLVTYSTRNLVNVAAQQAKYLNVFLVLNADTIIISKEGLAIVNAWLGPVKAKEEASK